MGLYYQPAVIPSPWTQNFYSTYIYSPYESSPDPCPSLSSLSLSLLGITSHSLSPLLILFNASSSPFSQIPLRSSLSLGWGTMAMGVSGLDVDMSLSLCLSSPDPVQGFKLSTLCDCPLLSPLFGSDVWHDDDQCRWPESRHVFSSQYPPFRSPPPPVALPWREAGQPRAQFFPHFF